MSTLPTETQCQWSFGTCLPCPLILTPQIPHPTSGRTFWCRVLPRLLRMGHGLDVWYQVLWTNPIAQSLGSAITESEAHDPPFSPFFGLDRSIHLPFDPYNFLVSGFECLIGGFGLITFPFPGFQRVRNPVSCQLVCQMGDVNVNVMAPVSRLAGRIQSRPVSRGR